MLEQGWSKLQDATSRKRTISVRGAVVALWLLILVYAAWFSILSIRQHDAFLTHRADLGNFDQAIWNTLRGRVLVHTYADQQATRLSDHFEPILIPLSLSFLLWDDVRALLVLQSVALALGALPLFWLTRDELRKAGYSLSFSEVAGLILASVYLLFPALEAANLTEFHAAPLMVTPMLLALYYARQGRYGRMWIWALVVMAVKEEMSLLTFMLAVWLIVFRREWKHGLTLAAVSLIWFGVAAFGIVPYYSSLKYGVGESVYFQRYGELGGSAPEVVRSVFTKPGLVWKIVSDPARLQYLLGLLLSAGLLLPLLAPDVLLLCLPTLAANLLSSYDAMYSGTYHYSAPVVPYVVAAAAVGLGRIGLWARRLQHRQLIVVVTALLFLAVSMVYHYHRGYTPVAKTFSWPEVARHHRMLEQRFSPQVPTDAVLSTTVPLFPHLDHRERIYAFPIVEDATWVLLDAATFAAMHPADMRRAYDELVASGSWCIVDAANGYVLLQRRSDAKEDAGGCATELPDEFYGFARADERQPQYRAQADFGGRIRLLGYDLTSIPQWRRVGVRLYWTKLSDDDGTAPDPDADLQVYPFWLGPGGTVLQTPEQRPLVEPYWYPASLWRPGEVVVTEMLPWDIGTEFRLAVAVLGSDGSRMGVERIGMSDYPAYAMDGESWLRLLAKEWVEGEVHPVDEAAALSYPMAAEFDGAVALHSYALEPDSPEPGQNLVLWLNWSSTGRKLERDHTVFVHVLNETGEKVAQGDGVPGYLGSLPTTLWRAGEPVLDRHVIPLPADLEPGRYSLQVGWYDFQTGERLRLSSGEDTLRLNDITIR